MPKVIVKSRYLTDARHMRNYLKYIATREGVELLPEAVKNRPATLKQRDFIEKHLKTIKELAGYACYLSHPSLDNASHLITAYAQLKYGDSQDYEKIARGDRSPPEKYYNPDNPATEKQKEWIKAHIEDAGDLLEYEDYIKKPTFENASELITAIAEYNTTDPEIYLKYIAERPGVYKHKGEAHGLWNMTGKADLNSELERIRNFSGVAWTHIISLRREDAQRLNFETAGAWRKSVASNAARIAKLYNIDLKNLNLLGAFHNEGHHPHVHLFVYSDAGGKEGIIPKTQLKQTGEKMRSMFTNCMFKADMEPLISRRNDLRKDISRRIGTISLVRQKDYELNPNIETMLKELAQQLPCKGKLQYAFLPHNVKDKVNDTLRSIIADDNVLSGLVSEYFSIQHSLIRQYNDDQEKTDIRFADFIEHFYEPQTGKYSKSNDITTLHNIILQGAASIRDSTNVKLHLEKGQSVKLISDDDGIQIDIPKLRPAEKPEAVPVDDNKFGSIKIKKVSGQKQSESLPSFPTEFDLFDAAGNHIAERKTDKNGCAVFGNLPEGTYTVNNGTTVKDNSAYSVKYAACTVVIFLARELASLCDTAETCSKPVEDRSRQRRRFKKRRKHRTEELKY